ncbi:Branched-chain amino acid aminotransferase/4-amino-4-deoxychorismate lyase [Amycolatopsis arida]|uniref:Branched-chain amino acid aminotransferase/4-amino-4-deoxychorismate lyase n=1 Tax=Amycolatopsis arida TaxID=587909 RepID=A0A1I5Z562_9PSEU|nr:branched-subunit amino acid aminotransferase/4-amino-4-deoxychorismate lyase [Amycolatopsis arida]SFQ51626.1 Branched-chain amino acid aminotransferase/4-amino-4-deoxychorismate lyase [Amycolatopsis arida]
MAGFPAELNGRPATAAELAVLATVNYGHFTAMQVRGERVRGLEAHLRRLAAATRTLFGHALDTGRVRDHLRHAVAGAGDVSARVHVFSLELPRTGLTAPLAPDVLVTLRPPSEPATTPVRLRSVRYARELPEVKHVGTFGLFHHARAARLAGFDDALFVTADGHVAEASISNVVLVDGGTVVFPDAPMLDGITQRLLRRGLARVGVPTVTRPVPLAEARVPRAAFLCNSASPAVPVAAIDGAELTLDPALTTLLTEAYDTTPWDEI